ncbi:MAG: DNA polymerase I [Gammaproteobacteria bacterium]|nr:DNA polymerase I [Gammaproteobacteria bacterium]
MMIPQAHFDMIWIVVAAADWSAGEGPSPLALAAVEARGTDTIEIRAPRLLTTSRPPYLTGPGTLVITTDAQVLAAVHVGLGWPTPVRLIDLLIEHRIAVNGRANANVGGLAGALLSYGLPASDALVSTTSPQYLRRRLAAVSALFDVMAPELDIGRALLRGRYLCAVGRIEATGVPVDHDTLVALRRDWPGVRSRVIDQVDRGHGIFRDGRFDEGAFETWLRLQEINWPLTTSGRLDLTDEVWRDMSRLHPQVRPLRELRTTLLAFDPHALTIGRDGRNRTSLRPFSTVTGRNAPSAKASVLGSAAWARHLIKPPPHRGIALIDWEQQEFGVAAALSGDTAMQRAYAAGDPYLGIAKASGAAPADATATSHPYMRDRYKACALGVQYGIGTARLARQLGIGDHAARTLLDDHRGAFPQFWEWCADVEMQAVLDLQQRSVFGWRRLVIPPIKATSLRNFPMQANGAEMMRLACCSVTEAGISVCAPNHDALLIEAAVGDLADAVATTRRLMADASEVVLDGFALRTSVKSVAAPDRWRDRRGLAVWNAVATAIGVDEAPAHQSDAT